MDQINQWRGFLWGKYPLGMWIQRLCHFGSRIKLLFTTFYKLITFEVKTFGTLIQAFFTKIKPNSWRHWYVFGEKPYIFWVKQTLLVITHKIGKKKKEIIMRTNHFVTYILLDENSRCRRDVWKSVSDLLRARAAGYACQRVFSTRSCYAALLRHIIMLIYACIEYLWFARYTHLYIAWIFMSVSCYLTGIPKVGLLFHGVRGRGFLSLVRGHS